MEFKRYKFVEDVLGLILKVIRFFKDFVFKDDDFIYVFVEEVQVLLSNIFVKFSYFYFFENFFSLLVD